MNEILEIGIYLFFNLISLYTIETAISVFTYRKKFKNKIYMILPYIFYFSIGVITYIWDQNPMFNTIIYIILILIVQMNFDSSFKYMITFSFSWTMFIIIIELGISNIYCKFLGVDLATMINDDILRLIGNAYIVLFTLVIGIPITDELFNITTSSKDI